ncbi:RidA family protein [Haloterrigena salifodinae]|uniref:RidA family protein n=1 Tax=Haloterrigena salifodinae TaxID=2675099 RepID=A0A8T8DVE6_9EURY|nr:RidA family protein [Haloterrigena salifodinae]QRV13524.1 RidA family protein [Haloterrigena salifodinae]
MGTDQADEPRPVRTTPARASESGRRQRDGTAFTGAFGTKTGSSDLLFVEGQLPESDGRLRADEPPSRQLERCLANLESELERRGRTADDVLKLTLYLAEMDAYEDVDETYQSYFDETHPARTTVGVCDLLGGAAVTVDAVVAIE